MTEFEQLTKNAPIIDASSPVVITIRPRDIEGAIARNPEKCVAARCVQRTFNGAVKAVKIGAMFAYIFDGKQVLRYRLAKDTQDMIRAYDEIGFYPSGVIIKLLPVCHSQRLGNGKPEGKRNPDAKPRPPKVSRPWLRHANQPATR